MRVGARQAILAGAACFALVGGRSSTPPAGRGLPSAAPSAPEISASAGELWLATVRDALDNAEIVRMPFAERGELGGFTGGAAAFEFDAMAGQALELTLNADSSAPGEPVYVEVFRVVEVLGEALHERLTGLRPGESSLRTRLPSDGPYHVLVQTSPSAGGRYRLTLELAAALPFPVVGATEEAIRGLFGASRDAGKRHHQGIDIFVQRLTPVLAVAVGRAMPREDALGGNTVWLNTPGTSYYYAHLDRVAVRDGQIVKTGDVLGYVGNTGNAGGTPSHLHFGVYRWGKDPIDPLPLLVGRRFPAQPAASADAGG